MTVSVRVWRHRDLKKLSHWTHFIYVYALSMCVAVPSFLEAMPPPPPPKYQRYNKLLPYQFSGKMSSICITRSLIYSSVLLSSWANTYCTFLDTVDSIPIVTIRAFTAVTRSAVLTKRVWMALGYTVVTFIDVYGKDKTWFNVNVTLTLKDKTQICDHSIEGH